MTAIAVLMLVSSGSAETGSDHLLLANDLLAKGEYTRFLRVMVPATRDSSLTAEQRMQAMMALAAFYEGLAGDLVKARGYYQAALSLPAPDNQPQQIKARERLDLLDKYEQQYREHDVLLQGVLSASATQQSDDLLRQQIEALKKIIAAAPQYYRMAEVHYALGDSYLRLKHYWSAYRHLQKAREIRPAIDRYLAIEIKTATARAAWLRALIREGLWSLLALLLAATVLLFYRAQPWQWLTFAHLLWGAALALAWICFFYSACHWLGERCVRELTLLEAPFDKPFFLYGTPGSPGSHALLQALLQYGLVSLCGIYLFTIAIARLKSRPRAAVAGALFSLVLCSTMTAFFYLQHCDSKCRPAYPNEHLGGMLAGGLAFIQSEPEPLLLTDPKAYPGIDVGMIKDKELQDWYMKYHPQERRD